MDTEQLRICFLEFLSTHSNSLLTISNIYSDIAQTADNLNFPIEEKHNNNPLLTKTEQIQIREIYWSFMLQGILVPGSTVPDNTSSTFPQFGVSEYGKKVLESKKPIPYDPTNYLGYIDKHAFILYSNPIVSLKYSINSETISRILEKVYPEI